MKELGNMPDSFFIKFIVNFALETMTIEKSELKKQLSCLQ